MIHKSCWNYVNYLMYSMYGIPVSVIQEFLISFFKLYLAATRHYSVCNGLSWEFLRIAW